MHKSIKLIFCSTGLLLSLPLPAAGDLTAQAPTEITVQLGDAENHLRFFPERIELETGRLYKLVLHNKSPQKHYFSSDGFSRAVFTRKIQVLDPSGTDIAEIKGTIRELEIYPAQQAEWWLIPVKSGIYDDLRCTIAGHAEQGMLGTIVVR